MSEISLDRHNLNDLELVQIHRSQEYTNWEPHRPLQTNYIRNYLASRGLCPNCARGFCVFRAMLEILTLHNDFPGRSVRQAAYRPDL